MPLQPIQFESPLADELIFESMNVSSGLSTLGEAHVTLFSDNADLVPEDLLGKPVNLKIELRDGSQRHINGYVARFGIGRHRGRHVGYQATIRPWLWFLTRTADSRIFQEKTVPDIVKAVFEDHGIARFQFNLFRTYEPRNYCVQYRESDFNFVARLLEEEGIYWYFEHTETEHKLILVDSLSSHDAMPDYEELPFYDVRDGVAAPDRDFVSQWTFTREVRSGNVVLRDYDFERPSSQIEAQVDMTRVYDLADKEVFDYPGRFTKPDVGRQYADNRLDEMQAGYQIARGTSIAQGLVCGHTLELKDHPREDQNIKYLLTQVDIQAEIDGDEGGSHHDGSFTTRFVAIPAAQQFRPPRVTRKPFVQGPQTAIVTGTAGEEIDTDPYGRIKVQFHWDRLGKKDEKSSCWIRVAQIWAGKNFGGIFIPRIGQEVIVDFLEGDPDQPIVTGRVYNREQMPPWNLPENKTQSGILSRSSKGGAYEDANAIRFEDKKGAEQVWIQAQKDMSSVIENDNSEYVGHDRSRTVKKHEKIWIGEGREVTIDTKGEKVTITGPRSFKLTGKEDETVTDGRKINITGTYEEYTTGERKMWTSGQFAFKAEGGAFFNGMPTFFAVADKLMVKANASMFLEAGATQNFKAAAFKFAAMGNYDFTGIQFNRTVVESNDVITGMNTSTYIGSARSTAMGASVEAFMGMSNSAAAGLAVESFLGLQITNVLALTMANEAISIGSTGIGLSVTGIEMGQAGIEIETKALKVISGGGGAGAGAGALSTSQGTAAAMAAAGGIGFGLGFGAVAAFTAVEQAKLDIKALIDTPGLTQATRDRLQRIVDSPFRFNSADHHPSDAENQAQAAALAADTPGATPDSDPSAALGPPAAEPAD